MSISINELEKSKSNSVWVLNASARPGVQPGIISITVREGNGSSASVNIPVTKVPVDLSTMATKQALVQNPNFRKAVASKLITIISDEDAQVRIKNNPDYEREYARIYQLNDEVINVYESASSDVKAMLEADSGNVTPFALNIAMVTENEEEVLLNIRNNSESLTVHDLKYIASTSTLPRVKALAAEIVTSRN